MTIYCFNDNTLQAVNITTFTNENIQERQNLQNALKRQIDVIAPDCMVIAEEFCEWEDAQRRIDLLAIARDGALVVIELKRDDGVHMELQAIRYAAMVSTLTFSRAVQIYQKYLDKNKINLTQSDEDIDAQSRLLKFMNWEEPKEEDFALDVRIILVSANFSKELTTSVMWLNERNIDIRCVRWVPHRLGDQILIDVQQIIPLPEAESYQVKIKQQSEERRDARKMIKDYTKYHFNGLDYNKRQLVLAVIQSWIDKNKPQTFDDLLKAFPQTIHTGGLFVPVANIKTQDHYRFFLEENEVTFQNTNYAISNQWGINTIQPFLDCARKLGFAINEIG